MKIPFYRVNAFVSDGLLGNPAGVCIIEDDISENQMQLLARDLQLPATVFYFPNQQNLIRWFAPENEIKLCGHGTLAVSHILFHVIGHSSQTVDFLAKDGTKLYAEKADNGEVRMYFPAINVEEVAVDHRLEEALGLKVFRYFKSSTAVAILEDGKSIKDIKPNFPKLFEAGCPWIGISGKGVHERQIISRFFHPGLPGFEDPVTGSFHCALATVWHGITGKSSFQAVQASQRGGLMEISLDDKTVQITGSPKLMVEGQLIL